VSPPRRAQLAAADGLVGQHPGVKILEGEVVVAEGAIVAVKPPDVEAVCHALAKAGVPRVLSIAAGVTLRDLGHWCGAATAVVRAMPNTPALVGAAATAICTGPRSSPEDVDWAVGVMKSVGTVVEVPEHLIDAVTGLSGSGPAYVFLVAEAMIDGGVLMGLARPMAAELVAQTILGAGLLLTETGDDAAVLRAAVTSPGGTTAAGLRQLETSGARSAFIEAVAAAARRSHELGSPGPSALTPP
jgi:pyrroline-5-carboxylate reductase